MGARVLVVQHQDDDPPDRFGDWLVAAGCTLDVRRPYAGDALPPDLAGYDGLLVMGGHMNAHDDDRFWWLGPTKDLVRNAAADGVPALGICLGHQLAAAAFGGRSEPSPLGQLVGLHDVGWTAEAGEDPLTAGLSTSRRGVHWNHDVITPPPGTTVLAATSRGEVQAARFGPTVWGVQLHPEADAAMAGAWAEHQREDLAAGGVDVTGILMAIDEAREELDTAWQPLAAAFAGLISAAPVGGRGAS